MRRLLRNESWGAFGPLGPLLWRGGGVHTARLGAIGGAMGCAASKPGTIADNGTSPSRTANVNGASR